MAKGCEWNNQLAKENFETNRKEHGIEYAKESLRTDIHHWMAKREGREVPEWKARLDNDGHFVVADQRLLDLTRAPLDKKVDAPISEEVKALVPIEVETVLQAETQAKRGVKKIYMPEHAPSGIHYVTVYTQSDDDPREYIGSQIDLGNNFSWDQVKERMQTMKGDKTTFHQSTQHKEAFIVVEGDRSVRQYQKSFVGSVMNETVAMPQRVFSDVTSTAMSAGVFIMEALRRRRVQKQLQDKKSYKTESPVKNLKKEKKTTFIKEKKEQAKRLVRIVSISHFATETSVGIGGALFALRLVSYPEKRKERKEAEARYEKKRKKIIGIENRTKREVKKKKVKFKKGIELHKTKRTHRKERVGEKRKAEIRNDFFQQKRKEKKVFVKKNEAWKILVKLAKRIIRQEKHINNAEKEQIRKLEKRLISRFVFGWTLWHITSKNFHLSIDRSVKKKIERLVKKEPTQWVLLAIIWYLAMIREQGRPLTYKKQKKIPKHAVIFAFAS